MALVEYTWMQFQRLGHVASLPINEQIRQYHFYLDTLANERMRQSKGKREVVQTPSGYLLQEDSFYLLQENGDKITL